MLQRFVSTVAVAWLAVGAAALSETRPGASFRDCAECPEMIPVPAGKFVMGSSESDKDAFAEEKPARRIAIAKPFAIGKYEVTFDEWDACVAAKGCRHKPGDAGWGRGRQPVVNVSWNDVQAYLAWLGRKTGKAYRLPSEAEWEYAARGGRETRFAWGDEAGRNQAACYDCGSRWDGKQTAPVGSFAANGFGLHDVNGNVWEWTQDCWNAELAKMPATGAARLAGKCAERVLRGGSYLQVAHNIRTARRDKNTTTIRADEYGFRVVRAP